MVNGPGAYYLNIVLEPDLSHIKAFISFRTSSDLIVTTYGSHNLDCGSCCSCVWGVKVFISRSGFI